MKIMKIILNYTQKKDLVDSKKIICLKDFLGFKKKTSI